MPMVGQVAHARASVPTLNARDVPYWFHNLVAPSLKDYIPEPDGSRVCKPGSVNISRILKQPSCKDAPVRREWVGGKVVALPFVKELDPFGPPGLAPACAPSIRILRSLAVHMILGSEGDDCKLLRQLLRRGSYFNEWRILLLLQWFVRRPLQALSSPVPKGGPPAVWTMEEGKIIGLKRTKYYVLV